MRKLSADVLMEIQLQLQLQLWHSTSTSHPLSRLIEYAIAWSYLSALIGYGVSLALEGALATPFKC